jgi:hypothetical protein
MPTWDARPSRAGFPSRSRRTARGLVLISRDAIPHSSEEFQDLLLLPLIAAVAGQMRH